MIVTVLALACFVRPNLFVLAIGNSAYEVNPMHYSDKGFVPFEQLPQAEESARIVLKAMDRLGAAECRLLVPDTKSPFLTRDRIIHAIKSMGNRAAQGGTDSRLLLYYAGHGTSEGQFHNQYWWPGNVTLNVTGKSLEWVAKKLVDLQDVADASHRSNVRTIILSDACRSFDRKSINSLADNRLKNVLSDGASQSLGGTEDVVRAMMDFKCSEPAVLFASKPGYTAVTVDDPTDSAGQIAPIARRILLAEPALMQSKAITIDQFMGLISSLELDKQSPNIHTSFVPDSANGITSPVLLAKAIVRKHI